MWHSPLTSAVGSRPPSPHSFSFTSRLRLALRSCRTQLGPIGRVRRQPQRIPSYGSATPSAAPQPVNQAPPKGLFRIMAAIFGFFTLLGWAIGGAHGLRRLVHSETPSQSAHLHHGSSKLCLPSLRHSLWNRRDSGSLITGREVGIHRGERRRLISLRIA